MATSVKRKASDTALITNAQSHKTIRNANGDAAPAQTSDDLAEANALAPAPSSNNDVPVITNQQTANVLQYGSNSMSFQHSPTDSGLLHLLLDTPDHCMYTLYFETAIQNCIKQNSYGDPLRELLKQLGSQAHSMKWGSERIKAATDRVRAYSISYQAQMLASRIQNSGEFKVMIEALTKTVAGKAARAFDDPEHVKAVCGKVTSALNAAIIDIMKESTAVKENQAEASEGAANGAEESVG